MLRYKFRLTGKDIIINLPAIQGYNVDKSMVSFKNEVDKRITNTLKREKFLFENTQAENFGIKFFFDNNSTSFLGSGNIANNFTENDIDRNANQFIRSVFIVEVYDTTNSNTQTLMDTLYVHNKMKTGYNAEYDNEEFESNIFRYMSIPEWFIINNEHNGTATVYLKAYFYNAKTGRTYPFFPKENSNLLKEENHYKNLTINLSDFTYSINTVEFQLLNNTLLNNKLNNTPAISNQIPIQPENKILFFHDNGNYPDLIAEKELDPIIGTDGSDVAGNILETKFDGITVFEYTAEISDVEECSATVTVYIELHQDTVLTDPLVFDFSIDRLSSNATFVNESNLLTINPGSVSGTINIPISFTIEDETLCGNFELDAYEESGFVGVLFDPEETFTPIRLNVDCGECGE